MRLIGRRIEIKQTQLIPQLIEKPRNTVGLRYGQPIGTRLSAMKLHIVYYEKQLTETAGEEGQKADIAANVLNYEGVVEVLTISVPR